MMLNLKSEEKLGLEAKGVKGPYDCLRDIPLPAVAHVIIKGYGTHKQVFESLSLTVAKGETTAIVGESGSGKTTLISLLQNLYPIQSGSIYIGNMNIAQVSMESLHRLTGSVPQQIDLFAGTIIENIALGDFYLGFEKNRNSPGTRTSRPLLESGGFKNKLLKI